MEARLPSTPFLLRVTHVLWEIHWYLCWLWWALRLLVVLIVQWTKAPLSNAPKVASPNVGESTAAFCAFFLLCVAHVLWGIHWYLRQLCWGFQLLIVLAVPMSQSWAGRCTKIYLFTLNKQFPLVYTCTNIHVEHHRQVLGMFNCHMLAILFQRLLPKLVGYCASSLFFTQRKLFLSYRDYCQPRRRHRNWDHKSYIQAL